VPLYGFVVIWQQLDDLKHAAASKQVRVRAGLIVWLLVAGYIALRFVRADTGLTVAVIALLASSLLTALGVYLAQRSIVGYLAAAYPAERRRRVSVGEIVAALLTVLILASAGGLAYYWDVADAGPAVTYVPPAFPAADATLAGGWTQYRDSASGFAIQLPPDWTSFAYDTVDRGEEPTREIKFYAEANNKNANLVLERWVGQPISLDDYVAKFAAALKRNGAGEISRSRVTLSFEQAGLVRFSRTYEDAGSSITDHVIDYIVVKDRAFRTTFYRLQFSADSFTPALENTVWSIATTFRVL
jgi:hypothetical protein